MTTPTPTLFNDALALPVELRLALVDALLTSLNPPVEDEAERLWAEEAERRIEQIESGQAKLVPGDEAFARLRSKYGHRYHSLGFASSP